MIVTGELEGAEALAGVNTFQHVQEKLVEQCVVLGGDEQGLGRIIVGLEAVFRVVLLEVKQAACHRGLVKNGYYSRAPARAGGISNMESAKIFTLCWIASS